VDVGVGAGVGDSVGAGFGPRGAPALSSVAAPVALARTVVAGMTLKRNQLSFSPRALRVFHPLTLKVLVEPTIFRPLTATRPETPLRTITSFFNFPKDPNAFVSFDLSDDHVIVRLQRKLGFAPPARS